MPLSGGHGIYRSPAGRHAVRAWCRQALAAWPELRARTLESPRLGHTAVFHAPGGPGTPVLILPGTNFNAATTVPVARVLAADRPVHLVDLPGQPGLSDDRRPGGDRTMAYGAWLEDVLPRLTDRPVLVLGHSLGAAVALAASPSPLAAGLLLLNPAGLTAAVLSPALMRVTVPWLLRPGEHPSARLVAFMSGTSGNRADARSAARWLALVARHSRTGLAPGPLPAPVVARWSGTPVRVATGAHDRFYPPARLTGPARRLLGRTVHTFPDAGHLALHEEPERVRRLLRDLDAG
ncbi:alpha/beta fold hydrolase [Marinactinospora rubrisoli]|uniref:Alpha/beta fold hydrolase n=1 Tax=Marinactinospora rubrisoli TaxID=2715399 RepID=A0ABW2KLV9_9ACTN